MRGRGIQVSRKKKDRQARKDGDKRIQESRDEGKEEGTGSEKGKKGGREGWREAGKAGRKVQEAREVRQHHQLTGRRPSR